MYFIKNLKKYFFFLKPNSMAITFIMVLVLGMSSFSIDARLNPILHATDAINYDVFFDSLPFLPNNTDKFIFRNLFFFCYHFFDVFLNIMLQNSPYILNRIEIWAI